MLLNKPQAQALADAMAALNNVGATISDAVKFSDGKTVTFYDRSAGIGVSNNGQTVEEYESQSDFLHAHGLD